MDIIVILIFILGVLAFAYFKVPAVRGLIKKSMGGNTSGKVDPKRVDKAKQLLEEEKIKTVKLVELANLQTAINEEHKKQEQARQVINGK